MSKVTKRNLLEALGDAHIDVAYGVHDRPGSQVSTEQLPDFKPVTPKGQVAIQLSADKPPVDDSDYVPSPGRDLKLALAALSEKIPEEAVEDFYKRVRRMVSELSLEYLDETKIIKKEREKMKNLKRNNSGVFEARRMATAPLPRPKSRIVDPADIAADEEEKQIMQSRGQDQSSLDDEGADWIDIAKVVGYSGPSGPKNAELRTHLKLRHRLAVKPEDLMYAVSEAYKIYVRGVVKIYEAMPEKGVWSPSSIKIALSKWASEIINHPNILPSFQYMLADSLLDTVFDDLLLDYKLENPRASNPEGSEEFEKFVFDMFKKKINDLLPTIENKFNSLLMGSEKKDPVVAQIHDDSVKALRTKGEREAARNFKPVSNS